MARDYVAEAQAARNAGIAQSVKATKAAKAKKLYEDQVKAAHQVAYGRTTSGSSSSKSGGSGTTTHGGGGGGTVVEEPEYYEEPYIDWEAIERARIEAEERRIAEQRRLAQEAYDRNMSRIADAYNSASGNLKDNYNSTVDRLNVARDSSMNDVNTDAEKSLREAYINNMLTRKNLNQRLSAMGYNGGATETTMGSLENQYGSSRAGINEVLNKNISNLNQSYGDNLAGALQSYNSAKSNLDLQRMQLENAAEQARNNLEASFSSSPSSVLTMDQNYVNALKNVIAKQSAYNYNPTQATNNYVAGNAQQAQSAARGTNYAKYLAQAQLAAQSGTPTSKIQQDLYGEVSRGNLGIDTLYDILGQLGAR